jgi:hypothetical protein
MARYKYCVFCTSGQSDRKIGNQRHSAATLSRRLKVVPPQNRETVRIASTRYRIAIRSLSDSSRYRSSNFISSGLSRRLRRPLARQGRIPNISVMPCTFVIDDVLLYVRENFKNRIALSFLFVAGLKG